MLLVDAMDAMEISLRRLAFLSYVSLTHHKIRKKNKTRVLDAGFVDTGSSDYLAIVANLRQVSTTVSGFKEIDSMPSCMSQAAKSAWSEGP